MRAGLIRAAIALGAALAMAGCATTRQAPPSRPAAPPPPIARPAPPPPKPAVPPPPKNAVEAGVKAGPPVSSLDLSAEAAAAARDAFRSSCRALLRRTDQSGLTRKEDWKPACDAAAAADADPVTFFQLQFETVVVGNGATFDTGYYEPEIEGSREPSDDYKVPIYRKPPDLVEVDPGAPDMPTGRKQRGRIDENGQFQLYYDRAAIDAGALAGKGLEIAWAKDPIELFFLQIQGSGRLTLPDGQVMRIGYDGQNGREYVGIGKLMRDRGLVGPGTSYDTSMQGLMAYMRDHPDETPALLAENKSYVFFRELTGPGPLGALGAPVVGHVSVAADPNFTPLGAPVWLSVDRPEVTGLWVAQDTGGAIKGANRFDTFWGAGVVARITAGGMSARGQALILVPRGTVARLTAAGLTGNGGGNGGAPSQP